LPTYEYACRQCGNHLDVVQRFTDDALTTCPSCGGSLRKVFGNIGISFKGTGFYKNDSRSSDNGGKKKETEKETAKAESSSKSGEGAPSAGSEGSSTPKTDTPKTDTPRSNAPKADAPKAAS